jgi:hypothetical protein
LRNSAARISAAIALLDRGWGKPEQQLEVTEKFVDQMSDAELNAEIARLAALLGFADSQEMPPDSQETPPADPLPLQSHAKQLTHAP